MSGHGEGGEFERWAGAQLSGTGWSLATVRAAADQDGDLAAAALTDGFAAAARGVREADGVGAV